MKTIKKTKTMLMTAGIALALNIIAISTFAQDGPVKVHEVGLVFSNLNSFGLRYKCGNENMLLRITALSFNGNNTTNTYDNYSYNGISNAVPSTPSSAIGGGLNIGFEKRKRINDKSYFYYGIDWINTYTESKSNTTTPGTFTYVSNNIYQTLIYDNNNTSNIWSVSTGLGIVAGYGYRINDSFSLAVELIPSASYKYTHTDVTSVSNSVPFYGNGVGYAATPNITNQTTINSGITYSLTNAAASITIAYRLKRS